MAKTRVQKIARLEGKLKRATERIDGYRVKLRSLKASKA
jgi:hypothetical protein